MIYIFTRPHQMIGHTFTDDVAITLAFTKKQAIKKFNFLYREVRNDEVERIGLRLLLRKMPYVLTDY